MTTRFSATPVRGGAPVRRGSAPIGAAGPYRFLAPLLTIAFVALCGGVSALVPLVMLNPVILRLAVFVSFPSHAALRVSGAPTPARA